MLSIRPNPLLSHAAAVLSVALATVAALGIERVASVPNLSLLFVLPVVVCAIRYGAASALSAAVLGVLACNFYLIEPRFTLRVAEASNVLALVLLLMVALAVSTVTAQARRRTLEALEAAERAAAVRELARELIAERDSRALAARATEALAKIFRAPACVLLADGDALQVSTSDGSSLSDADLDAARLAMASGLATRGGAYPVGEASFDFWPLKTPLRRHAVVGVTISGDEAGRPAEPEKLVETVLGYLAVALDREAYAAKALAGEVAVAEERLKTDLLAAVSHDLKTPLSTILFTLESLTRFDHEAQARSDLLAGAAVEASRLSGMVDNLLDMNRIEAGAVSVRLEACDAADLIQAALLRSGATATNAAASGVVLRVDPTLFETALSNVLGNAMKYAGGSEIVVAVGASDGLGWVEVADHGPGFGGDAEPLFEKFARGQAGDGRPPGTGLGLALARAFLRAMQGDVTACDRDSGGAIVRLTAPLA
jgi:K+-sensing histidine kinase KdpD